jgi:hypothetical protein
MSDDIQIVHETGVVGLVIGATLAFAALVVLVALGLVVGLIAFVVDEVRERRLGGCSRESSCAGVDPVPALRASQPRSLLPRRT